MAMAIVYLVCHISTPFFLFVGHKVHFFQAFYELLACHRRIIIQSSIIYIKGLGKKTENSISILALGISIIVPMA